MLIHTRLQGHVDAPIETAMAFTREIQTLPLWHVLVVEAKDIAGSFDAPGSTATLTLKGLDGLHDFRIEVTEAEPLQRTAQRGQQVDGPMRYTSTMEYKRAGTGFDWIWEQENELPDTIPSPFGTESFLTRYFEQTLSQSADNLRLLLEALVPQPI